MTDMGDGSETREDAGSSGTPGNRRDGGTPVLEAKGIRKTFGHNRVLRGIDLTLRECDHYVILGSNGTGKTTLVRVLSTLLHPEKGTIRLFGKDPRMELKSIRERIGFLSHEPFLYGGLTASENLTFFAGLYGLPDIRELVKRSLKEMGLFHRAHDRVDTFSRGMKQRLGLARALLHDPDLLFLDEPYTGLDIEAQALLNKRISAFTCGAADGKEEGAEGNPDDRGIGEADRGNVGGQRGRTVILITHDIEKARGVATRFGILSKGRIIKEYDANDIGLVEDAYRRVVRGEKR